jgi:hypothetical protein
LMNRKLLPHRNPRRMKRSQSVREVVAVMHAMVACGWPYA